MATSPIGRDTPRVDGPLKVSGRAQYASDFHFPGMLHAVPVGATIASGRVAAIDAAAACRGAAAGPARRAGPSWRAGTGSAAPGRWEGAAGPAPPRRPARRTG